MSPEQRGQEQLRLYGCVSLFALILTVAAVQGLTPSFFIQGVGPTVLRQVVLAAAVILYVSFVGFSPADV